MTSRLGVLRFSVVQAQGFVSESDPMVWYSKKQSRMKTARTGVQQIDQQGRSSVHRSDILTSEAGWTDRYY